MLMVFKELLKEFNSVKLHTMVSLWFCSRQGTFLIQNIITEGTVLQNLYIF